VGNAPYRCPPNGLTGGQTKRRLMVIETDILSLEIRSPPHPKPCGKLSLHTAFKDFGRGLLTQWPPAVLKKNGWP